MPNEQKSKSTSEQELVSVTFWLPQESLEKLNKLSESHGEIRPGRGLASGVVALTLTPALCATLLKPIPKDGQHHGNGLLGRFARGFNRRFDPHFMAVRAAIDAGKIGLDVKRFTADLASQPEAVSKLKAEQGSRFDVVITINEAANIVPLAGNFRVNTADANLFIIQ